MTNLSSSACGAGSGVRSTDPCTCLQDGARHDDGQKTPSDLRADDDPSAGQELPSEGLGQGLTYMHLASFPRLARRRPALTS